MNLGGINAIKAICLSSAFLMSAASALAEEDPFNNKVKDIQRQLAVVTYQITDKEKQLQHLDELANQSHKLSEKYPQKTEPDILEGIALSQEARVKGGLGSLKYFKKAKAALERAERNNPTTLDSTFYASIGALYYQVPGWPLGFRE